MPQTIGRSRGRPRSFNDNSQANRIQALDRGIDVLKVVARNTGLSLTEISELTGHPTATVYRILITLQMQGMVELQEETQLWRAGLEAFVVGTGFLGRTSIAEQSAPIMQRLMSASGETANLAIIDQHEVVFIRQVETHQPIRAFFRPGTRGLVHASGIGKALLAFLKAEQSDVILKRTQDEDGSLPRYTEHTLISPEDMRLELAKIRKQGFAVDDEERTEGMRCIAAPIFDQFGEAVAGISISGPSVRVRREMIGPWGNLVAEAASEVTSAIGGRKPEYTADGE